MVFFRRILIFAPLLLLPLTSCVKPTLQDLSPDTPNGTLKAEPSTAGLTITLGGDSTHLYAVSLNAGIWRSNGANAQWQQLLNSPQRAYSLAVDPENPLHLVTGERQDDTIPPSSGTSGIWESFDAGDTWTYILNPLNLGCSGQAISSVVFDGRRNLFAGTTCGVARRLYKSTAFTIVAGQSTAISALVATPNRIWARNGLDILFGDSAGDNWQTVKIPAKYSQPDEKFTLGATDGFAYIDCCNVQPSVCGRENTLVIYNVSSNTWYLQPRLTNTSDPPATGCDGTGLGGSLFLRSFFTVPQNAGSLILFDSSAQEVYEATPGVSDGIALTWNRPLGAFCKHCTNQDAVHSDTWDFLYVPPAGNEWVSNDGGVYEHQPLPVQPWRMRNWGLHTHHVHTLTLLNGPSIAYPTSDNDAWFSSFITSPSSWHATDLGDVNWSDGDVANAQHALVARDSSCASLVSPITGASQDIAITYDAVLEGPEGFKIIQSLASENYAVNGAMDAVMLVRLPLHYHGGVCEAPAPDLTVSGELGSAAHNGELYLIRNPHFDSNPNINKSAGQGWSLEVAVPLGTTRFWVSGGHANPVYYAYTRQAGQGHLYRHGVGSQWQELNVQGKIADPTPYSDSQMVDSVFKGPVFVNPYNPAELYVLTATGVRVSEDSGTSFNPDTQLSQLITGNSTYRLLPGFAGDKAYNVRFTNRFNLNPMGALTSMAFRRDKPDTLVAASPYTGIFYKEGGGAWTDLNSFFPNPIAPISSVAIDSESIYFATEGRGIFRLIAYQNAGLYLWLQRDRNQRAAQR